jgi:polyisoprenoid-binding protein YceI
MEKTAWVIDPTHSEIQFKVKHLVISTVTGSFKSFGGNANTSGERFENAEISFEAHVNSIFTNQNDRDYHLKSADFFDAENHPKLSFKSTSMTKTDDDEFELNGDLTIKGITKSVKLEVEFGGEMTDPYGNHKAGFELKGKINRKDFGLAWSAVTEAGGIVVGDEVKLLANVQLVKQ